MSKVRSNNLNLIGLHNHYFISMDAHYPHSSSSMARIFKYMISKVIFSKPPKHTVIMHVSHQYLTTPPSHELPLLKKHFSDDGLESFAI